MFADDLLAKRLEGQTKQFYIDFGQAVRDAGLPGEPFADFGDTCALFAGDGSPLTQAVGQFSDEALTALADFYRGRASSWEAVLTPFAGIDALTRLVGPNWEAKPMGWESTLYMPLSQVSPGQPLSEKIELREVALEEREAWAELSRRSFFGEEPDEVGTLLSRLKHDATCLRAYMAFWDGVPAAAASMTVGQGVAVLGGGVTAPEFRGKGLHAALIQRRVQDAAREADVVTVDAAPGSTSHRNMERLGFRIAWSQLSLRVPL